MRAWIALAVLAAALAIVYLISSAPSDPETAMSTAAEQDKAPRQGDAPRLRASGRSVGTSEQPIGELGGTILAADGTVPVGARVWLLPTDGRGIAQDLWGREAVVLGEPVEVDDRGRYGMERPDPGQYWIAVTAPHQPCVLRRVTVPESGSHTTDIVLPAGFVLKGRVRLNGRSYAGAEVRVNCADNLGAPWRLVCLRGEEYVWVPSEGADPDGDQVTSQFELVPKLRVAASDAQGGFLIGGLRMGKHLFHVEFTHAKDLVVMRSELVSAPDREIDLDYAACELELHTASRGRSVPATLRIEGAFIGSGAYASSKDDGVAHILLPRHVSQIVVSGYAYDEYEDFERTVRLSVGVRQRVDIDLVRKPDVEVEEAPLVVELNDARGKPIRRTGYTFMDSSVMPLGEYDVLGYAEADEDGRFHLLAPKYAETYLHLRPGRTKQGAAGYGLALAIRIDHGAQPPVFVRESVAPGGRLRIRVRGRHGHVISAPLWIEDANGKYVERELLGTRFGEFARNRHISFMGGWATVDPPLPPGRYVITTQEFPSSGRTIRKEVDVVAGKTMDVELQIPPAR